MAYEGYARLELMGHRSRYGLVSEEECFGIKMLRIDIPFPTGNVTEFYGGASIYALTPVSREIAIDRCTGDPRPVRPLDYRVEDKRAAEAHEEQVAQGRWDPTARHEVDGEAEA